MNYENNDMLTSPNLSYTSRDFNSIYNELMSSIPLLTKSWEPKDENDPGVVLIKLISMLGDMLSYNSDKQALEAFPRTVLQRANAQQIFRLVGYKMHWWRSAIVEARFTNANTFPIIIGRYNTFSTKENNIIYTNIKELTIPSGSYGDNSYKAELIQGIPVTPILKGSVKPTDYNSDWHSSYDYNVNTSDIVNNRLYLKYSNIDETSITLIDNDETPFAINEWKLVDNINLSENMEKVFEFDVDENNNTFIQFPSYWSEKYVITKFKIFFVLSNGKDGEIEENTLSTIYSNNCYIERDNISIDTALEQVQIFNSSSTYGYNPQTCTEARIDSEKYINTINTLVTLKDFEKAVSRIDSVANVIATDIQNDPYLDIMTDNDIKLYIVRKSDYNNTGSEYIYTFEGENDTVDELFKENVIGELNSYKTISTNISVYLENYIDWIDWTVSGQIFLRTPINADQNNDLMVRINNNLKNRFNCETLDFNEPINYMDVIECIMKTDKNIWHVDLDSAAIQYTKAKRSLKGNPTGMTVGQKYKIYDEAGNYTGYYANSLGCTSININNTPTTDLYNNMYSDDSSVGYLAGTNTKDITKTPLVINSLTDVEEVGTFINNSVVPGGDGYGQNSGSRIIRELDNTTISSTLFGVNNPRELEIYNTLIYDWTGVNPEFTGCIIVKSEAKSSEINEYKIMKYNVDDNSLTFTGYKIRFDTRIYLPDGSDSGLYLKENNRFINIIEGNTDDHPYLVLDICRIEDNEWINLSIYPNTGEMFIYRNGKWYHANKAYNADTGEITDTFGPVLLDENFGIIREPACREDITGEYIQFYEVDETTTSFDFYLGQKANGEPEFDSKNEMIEAYPIKPGSLYIYINGDLDILSDTGTGSINGTPGLLNGNGIINYSTGQVSFTLNEVPKSMKIMYKVNKLTYARYFDFSVDKLFVRPEYIRSDIRK